MVSKPMRKRLPKKGVKGGGGGSRPGLAELLNRAGFITIRRLVADYIQTEGCDCCEGDDHTDAHLAKLLRVPKYKDGSGYDWKRFQSKECRPTRVNRGGQ